MVKIDKKWWKSTKNGENRQKMVLLPSKMVLPPSKMVLPPSKMVLPQAMAWVQYWFRVLSLKFCGKSKKICGDISQLSPAFCMYGCIKDHFIAVSPKNHHNEVLLFFLPFTLVAGNANLFVCSYQNFLLCSFPFCHGTQQKKIQIQIKLSRAIN